MKELWKTLSEITTNKQTQNAPTIHKIKKEETILTEKQQIANEMNNYFAKIGEQLANQIPTFKTSEHINFQENTIYIQKIYLQKKLKK